MNLTPFAQWLNDTFAAYDYTILHALHQLAVSTNQAVTPFFIVISLLAQKGVGMLILGLILTLIPKTRKIGITVLFAVLLGALFTNVCIKPFVARPRPFLDPTKIYHSWWQFVGAHQDHEFSFPSGHTTATMASMTAIFLTTNRKKSWTCFLFVFFMGLSRNYLMMHYPSDILGGIFIGAIAGTLSYFAMQFLFQILEKKNLIPDKFNI